ncbi:MAG: flagellar brake protein [Leptospirillia bacterium]
MAQQGIIPSFFQCGRHRQHSLIFTERLLQSMARERSPLLVFFETHIHLVYSSMLLGADREGNSLLLDPLNPEEGNNHLVPGHSLVLYGKNSGIETGFLARIRGLSEISSGRAILLEFPHETYHCQRRESLRVPLPSDLPPVRISTRTGHQEIARLVDIGAMGVRFLVEARNEKGLPQQAFREEQIVLIPKIDLGTLSLPSMTARLIHLERAGFESDLPLLSLGLRFLDLPEELSESLATYVMKRDVERLLSARDEHLA